MVSRNTTTEKRAAAHDEGRINSERTMEKGSSKKWMDGMNEDSDKELDAAMKHLKLAEENVVKRAEASTQQATNAINAALDVVNHQKEILEGAKSSLERSMSAGKISSRIAAEKEVAREALAGEKKKALTVSGDTTTWGQRRAESSALEMAKGAFTMPVSER